jgi:predicted nucleic acid-binding protein
MQIAAHALRAKAILVSSDKAFQKITAMNIQDWTLQVSAL